MSTLQTEGKPAAQTAPGRTAYATPRANIFETKDGYILEAELPGVNREGLEVTVEDGELTLSGKRSDTTPQGNAVYRESRDFDYRRVFDLDPSIDAGKITARLEDGVLTLTLPKAESVKPRKIAVTG